MSTTGAGRRKNTAPRRSGADSAMMRILPFEVIKWAAFIAVLVIVILSLRKSRPSSAVFADVQNAVVSASQVAAEKESGGAMVKRLYSLEPGEYDGIYLSAPVNAMDAEELLLVKLKDMAQEEDVLAAMNARVTKQLNAFEGYGVNQTAMLEKSIVTARGGYVLLYVGERPDEVKAAFEKAL